MMGTLFAATPAVLLLILILARFVIRLVFRLILFALIVVGFLAAVSLPHGALP